MTSGERLDLEKSLIKVVIVTVKFGVSKHLAQEREHKSCNKVLK